MATGVYEEIRSFIENDLIIKRTLCTKRERDVEKVIIKQMCESFSNFTIASQCAVGGFWSLRCDIDVNEGQCGIELKLAKELESAHAFQRVLGQVFYYAKNRYKNSCLILLVVGTASQLSPKLKELRNFVEQIPGVHFIYKQTAKKLAIDTTSKTDVANKKEHTSKSLLGENVFCCKSGLCFATGVLLNDGFLVHKGSAMRADVRSSAKPAFIKQRKQFIEQYCHIVNGVPVTKADYVFPSPSTAAAMFLGGSANGWTEWKNDKGQTLSKVYRKK